MKTWITLIFCLVLFPWLAQSAEYYRWVDENGVSHVTDQPPPETVKKVKTYRLQQPTKLVAPESQTSVEMPGGVTEGTSEGGQPTEDQQEPEINQEVEKARQEYEDAKSHETEYRRNFNESYGYGKERKAWRDKLEDIENKRQKLENLESGGSVGGEASTPNSQADQPPM